MSVFIISHRCGRTHNYIHAQIEIKLWMSFYIPAFCFAGCCCHWNWASVPGDRTQTQCWSLAFWNWCVCVTFLYLHLYFSQCTPEKGPVLCARDNNTIHERLSSIFESCKQLKIPFPESPNLGFVYDAGFLGRPPGPEMEYCTDRESYSLAAGLALGMVCLGVNRTNKICCSHPIVNVTM